VKVSRQSFGCTAAVCGALSTSGVTYLGKNGVHVVQVPSRPKTREKLAPIGVFAAVGHGDGAAPAVDQAAVKLVVEGGHLI
jgi:hypothetical protein